MLTGRGYPLRVTRRSRVLLLLLALPILLLLLLWGQAPQRVALWLGASRAGRPPPASPPACAAPCAPAELTVASLNVMCSFCAKEGYDDWATRLPHLRALLRATDADVIGVQELVGEATVSALLAGDGLAEEYGVIAAPGLGGVYADSALLYRRARLVVEVEGEIWLGPSPRLPLSWGWSPARFPRLAVWAQLRDRQSGQALLLVTTHLDNDARNRERGAALVGETFAPLAEDRAVVLLGDLNTRRGDARFTAVTRGALEDAEALAGAGATRVEGTLSEALHTRRELRPDRRIDHVLLGSPGAVEVLGWRHLAPVYGEPPRRPSDHPAVAARVRLLPVQ